MCAEYEKSWVFVCLIFYPLPVRAHLVCTVSTFESMLPGVFVHVELLACCQLWLKFPYIGTGFCRSLSHNSLHFPAVSYHFDRSRLFCGPISLFGNYRFFSFLSALLVSTECWLAASCWTGNKTNRILFTFILSVSDLMRVYCPRKCNYYCGGICVFVQTFLLSLVLSRYFQTYNFIPLFLFYYILKVILLWLSSRLNYSHNLKQYSYYSWFKECKKLCSNKAPLLILLLCIFAVIQIASLITYQHNFAVTAFFIFISTCQKKKKRNNKWKCTYG